MGALKQLLIAAQEGDRQAREQVALLMGGPNGCTCLPGLADDQCPLHGYEAWKARRDG